MLELLRIQNYALIDELEIEFGPGFNALTGETGAGKSIVVGALNLVLGGRASSETVREGGGAAKVEALFRLGKPAPRLRALLKHYEVELEEDTLLLSRVVTAEGRSRGYLGGRLVPVSVLGEFGDELVDLHGQHEHQSLLQPERQMELLDGFGGTSELVVQVGALVGKVRELEREMAALEGVDQERARRLEYLRHEAAEIAGAELKAGEEEELRSRRNLIQNWERIAGLAGHARAVLYEDEERPAITALDAAEADIQELTRLDGRFQGYLEQLAGARAAVEEVAGEIRRFAEGVEFDAEELERLNARLALLGELRRKYGSTVEEVMAYGERAAAEVAAYEGRDERLASLRVQRARALADALEMAKGLSAKRQAAARRLDKQVTAVLQELGMKGGAFQTGLEPCDLGSGGIDRVEFMLSANVGEKVKVLRQVASGGEISRIMLGLKAVFAGADHIPSLIFDEIDAGVGGQIARKVADKMEALAASHQVICITHIAQIAAAAGRHFHVAKSVRHGRTSTAVSHVDGEGRVVEIARLLDGSASDVSIKHARVLLGL